MQGLHESVAYILACSSCSTVHSPPKVASLMPLYVAPAWGLKTMRPVWSHCDSVCMSLTFSIYVYFICSVHIEYTYIYIYIHIELYMGGLETKALHLGLSLQVKALLP